MMASSALVMIPVTTVIMLLVVLIRMPSGSWPWVEAAESVHSTTMPTSFSGHSKSSSSGSSAVEPSRNRVVEPVIAQPPRPARRLAQQHTHPERLRAAAAHGAAHKSLRGTRRPRRRRRRNGSKAERPRSSKYAYFGFNGRWQSHSNLTYALSKTDVTPLVPRSDILLALESAFGAWATVVPLTFTLVDDEFWEWADIKVSFLGGDHGDGQPFDGILGVLGHSFAPEDGRMHLDIAEQWSVDVNAESDLAATMDLQSVVLHEVGHLIGLGHSEDSEAAMFADIAPHQVSYLQLCHKCYHKLVLRKPKVSSAYMPVGMYICEQLDLDQ